MLITLCIFIYKKYLYKRKKPLGITKFKWYIAHFIIGFIIGIVFIYPPIYMLVQLLKGNSNDESKTFWKYMSDWKNEMDKENQRENHKKIYGY